MSELKVRDLMSTKLITAQKDENLNLAEEVMQLGRIRHLPVVDDGRLVGLITHRDLLRAQISALAELSRDEKHEIQRSIAAADIMQTDITTTGPDTPALEAARLMVEHRFGCLPVVENERLVGIVTEADFMHLVVRVLDVTSGRSGSRSA